MTRAVDDASVDGARCKFCAQPHEQVPDDLCVDARREYDRVTQLGHDLGLEPEHDTPATGPQEPAQPSPLRPRERLTAWRTPSRFEDRYDPLDIDWDDRPSRHEL